MIKDQIKSKEAIVAKLKGDVLKVHSSRPEYKSQKSYEADIKRLEKEIGKLQGQIDTLKTKVEL